jgi:serine/threonine protein kinase
MSADSPSDPDRHPVDLLAEEFAERCRRGEHVSVSDYANRHPEHAQQLRELLPPIALMEKLKRRNSSGSGGVAVATALKLERLGDFRIVREIGRGGMGIVYEAVQESLDRHVALKVLSRASMLDEQHVQRFEQEARAAAGLHHTNIVPIFGVGQHDGLHYLVMQLIPGRSLAEILCELSGGEHPAGMPTGEGGGGMVTHAVTGNGIAPPRGKRYWRWAADLARQTADALHYAHCQGILHRDVKPANVLLDERGAAWITDFGLAKLAGELQPRNVTRSGDVIGTLQYMAPEGLHSQADARSDNYGLGLVLYELLALRPAFDAANPAALLRRISESEPLRLRRVNAAIPADLETIVLKATARDPAARYATAADLAEDLENYLHDRPIAARRASSVERLWRWCRRNRAVAALAALAIACALGAIVIGWSAYVVTRRSLAAEASLRRRADANVEMSLKGFEEIFNQLAPEEDLPPPVPLGPRRQGGGGGGGPGGGGPGGGGPGGGGGAAVATEQASNAAMLKSILSFYDRFTAQNSTNRALQAEAARAYRRVGDSYLRLSQFTEADSAYRRSAAMYDALLKGAPQTQTYQTGFVEASLRLGMNQAALSAEDGNLIRRAAIAAEGLAGQHEREPRIQELLSRVLLRDGNRLRQRGDIAGAEQRYRQSAQAWKAAGPPPRREGNRPDGRPPRPAEGYAAPLALAELLVEADRKDDARIAVRDVMGELDQTPPDAFRGGERLPAVYDRVARVAEAAGEGDIAKRAKERAADGRLHDAERALDGRRGPGGPGGPGGGGRPPPPLGDRP